MNPLPYPFRSHFVALAEGRIHYADEGDGPPVLFVHGTPYFSFEWRHTIAALRDRYRCIAPDLLGFGYSDRPTTFSYAPEDHAGVVRRFVDALGLRRFTLVVHDFGGPIALPLALDTPERIEGLVLINTWMWSWRDDPKLWRTARFIASPLGRWLYRRINLSLRVLAPAGWADRRRLTPALQRTYLDRFPDADARERVLWSLARSFTRSEPWFDALWQRRDRLRNIPSCLIWGERDRALTTDMLQRWRRTLEGERAVLLADAGHWPHEEVPTQVIEAMTSYMDSIHAFGGERHHKPI